jgi:hypothetical protein
MKRETEEQQKVEVTNSISNIERNDTFDEVIFKMYEQVKNYNNRLSDFLTVQKDLTKTINKLEMYYIFDFLYM